MFELPSFRAYLSKKGDFVMEEPVTAVQPPQEPMSFLDKAAGVFYEPSKVFGSLKSSGVKVADWLVPVLLLAIIVGVAVYVRFSSPDLRFQAAQQQEQRFDKMVAEGKMTSEQAEQAKTLMENGSTSFMGIGIFMGVVVIVVIFFVASAVWLLVGKFALKGAMDYSLAMGVTGLATWILIVGAIIGILMTVLLSHLDAGLNLGMLTQSNAGKTYSLLRSVDLFGLWNLFAISVGLGSLSGKKGAMPAVWVFGVWIVILLLSVFALGGMFGG